MSSEEKENWKWVERKVERGEDKKKGREKLKRKINLEVMSEKQMKGLGQRECSRQRRRVEGILAW